MKRFYKGMLVIMCFFLVCSLHGQNLFDVELYGGINKNYFQAGQSTAYPDLQFSNALGQHVGLNFLPRISQNWQLSIQTEWMRSVIQLNNLSFSGNNIYNSYGNYSIGARYNLEKEKHAFYFQPSFGLSINNYSQPYEITFMDQNNRDVQFVARAEAGVKFYTKRRNYLLIGLRHQQGFASTTPYGSEAMLGLPLAGRNSYTGLFMGYGLNTDNWSKSKRSFERTIKPEILNPWQNGIYLKASATLRRVNERVFDPSDDFQNVSTAHMFGLGYRFGDFSIETGYAQFRGRNVFQLISPEGIAVETIHRKFSAATVPITVRYDRQLPINKKIRIGVSFTAHIPVNSQNSGETQYNASGSNTIDGVAYPYQFQSTGLATNSKRVFFNSGFYTEMPLFRTGLITFKASKNYGSPSFDRFFVDYQVDGVSNSFESKGKLDGWQLELEYSLPLHHIFKSK